MPGKLEISNGSSTQNILISLQSIDEKEYHLALRTLEADETTSAIVKGGVKKLIVASESGDVFWEGAIPSYGSSPIIILPESKTVTYQSMTLVNTHVSTSDRTFPMWLAGLIILITIAMFYIYRRR